MSEFESAEIIEVVPSRMGRPAVGQRFAPRARIVPNERWLSVYVGNERVEKIGRNVPDAEAKAKAVVERIISDFHAKVEEHNRKVLEAKAMSRIAEIAEHARAIAALDAEYGAIRAEVAAHDVAHPPQEAPAPVVTQEAPTEEAPAPVVTQEAPTEEAPAPVVTQEAPTEEAPAMVTQEAPTEEAPAMVTQEENEPLTATQVERPAARVTSIVKRPVRNPASKPKKAAPRKRAPKTVN